MITAHQNGSAGRVRARLETALLRAVRLYTYHTPVSRGKYRLFIGALKLCHDLPKCERMPTKDGRYITGDLRNGMHTSVFFLGEYEKALTDIIGRIVKPGDVCIDAGANFGWYTTLFRKLVGGTGSVHAFEPVPVTFRELEENWRSMGRPKNVLLNNVALGDKAAKMEMHVYADEPTGHASLSAQGRDDFEAFECEVITLNSYLAELGIENVDFIKVDVEGAETMFLQGATALFRQRRPPILLMEMALQTLRNFGHVPNDIVQFISGHAEYRFYVVDENEGRLSEIRGFDPDDIGANVLCVPHARQAELSVLADRVR